MASTASWCVVSCLKNTSADARIQRPCPAPLNATDTKFQIVLENQVRKVKGETAFPDPLPCFAGMWVCVTTILEVDMKKNVELRAELVGSIPHIV